MVSPAPAPGQSSSLEYVSTFDSDSEDEYDSDYFTEDTGREEELCFRRQPIPPTPSAGRSLLTLALKRASNHANPDNVTGTETKPKPINQPSAPAQQQQQPQKSSNPPKATNDRPFPLHPPMISTAHTPHHYYHFRPTAPIPIPSPFDAQARLDRHDEIPLLVSWQNENDQIRRAGPMYGPGGREAGRPKTGPCCDYDKKKRNKWDKVDGKDWVCCACKGGNSRWDALCWRCEVHARRECCAVLEEDREGGVVNVGAIGGQVRVARVPGFLRWGWEFLKVKK